VTLENGRSYTRIPVSEPCIQPVYTPAVGSSAAVVVRGVRREFRGRIALDGVSLLVRPYELHALLGPNGAGKTTLLRIVAGLTAPTSGRVEILGLDAASDRHSLRRLVGVVPAGGRTFYQRISALENLVFFGRLHGLRRAEANARSVELLDRVGLGADGRTRVGEYSQGMERRLAIARALLARPRILLVDEATHDLDPAGAQSVRALVHELRDEGAAVIWATQRVDEIQGYADEVTLLQSGQVRFHGTVPELVAQGGAARYVVDLGAADRRMLDPAALNIALADTGQVESAGDDGRFVLALADPDGLGAALARLLDAGIDVLSCQHEQQGVERAFLTLTASGS
jgi:ABC-2 type transport system ATP-binding protein